MRLKIRLYPKDIDLIAIRGNPNIKIESIIQTVLSEYVASGINTKIHIPPCDSQVVYIGCPQLGITIHDESVIAWIKSLPAGERCNIVKTVIRTAIENLPVHLFKDEQLLQYVTEHYKSQPNTNRVKAIRPTTTSEQSECHDTLPLDKANTDIPAPYSSASQSKPDNYNKRAFDEEDNDDEIWELDDDLVGNI